MANLTAAVIVQMWEDGLALNVVQRPLMLLALADKESPLTYFAQMSIGQRDAALLHLRERLFGIDLTTLSHCDACGEPIETQFKTRDIDMNQHALSPSQQLIIELDGFMVRYRLPDSYDLEAAIQTHNTQLTLLGRCITEAYHAGTTCNVEDLPQKVTEALAIALESSDPQANIQLEIACPGCSQLMLTTFDIATFLWHEIETHAHSLMLQVHTLARAYGWHEHEILAMSSWRRRQYLELVHG